MPISPTLEVERSLLAGHHVAAIYAADEVGRGAISGPAACGIAYWTPEAGDPPTGLADSKLLTPKRRAALLPAIASWIPVAVGLASATEVDTLGISRALGLAASRAIAQLPAAPLMLLDGNADWCRGVEGIPPRIMRVKADRDCASVAAASVVAKETRDAIMARLGEEHPHYGWGRNAGYGSADHYAAIRLHGPVPGIHRLSWLKPSQLPEAG